MSLTRKKIANHRYMPVCLRLYRERCLVVGGGNVALRKVRVLRKFGGLVTCISPEFIHPLASLGREKKIKCIRQPYPRKISLKKYALVIAATDDPRVNIRVARDASRDKTPVNIVDNSVAGTLIMPAILKRKGLLVSVSSGGLSPSEAKKVRDIVSHAL